MQTEVNLLIQLFRMYIVAATFHQCLPLIVSKLGKTNPGISKKKNCHGTDSLVPGTLCWWAGVGNDQLIADCISGCRKAMNIGQKLAEKEPLGLKYA